MKLSIIIPVYRVEVTLERCLQSIVGQTFRDFEAILVDDGSPDNCPKLCDEWAERDGRIRVVHKQNGGLSDARNAGINAAKGEYLTFVDSDDFLSTDTYEQVMPLTAENDIVEFPVYWHYGAEDQRVLSFGSIVYEDMRDYWLNGFAYEHTYAWNKIYRRELFEDVRFPVGKVFEDVATLPLLLKRARRVATTAQGLYYYCTNPQGITAQATGRELTMLLESHLPILQQYCDERYYMHVLNIQMDVCETTAAKPMLPVYPVNPFSQKLSTTLRLKALMLKLLGIKGICRLNQLIHQTVGRRS